MPLSFNPLPKFAPVVARHFAAYLELFADEAAELGSHVAKRVLAMVIALLSAGFAVAMACVWILNAVWDTAWRQVGIAGLFIVFVAGGVFALVIAFRRAGNEQKPFNRLRSEWDQDQQLITEFINAYKSEKPLTAAELQDAES